MAGSAPGLPSTLVALMMAATLAACSSAGRESNSSESAGRESNSGESENQAGVKDMDEVSDDLVNAASAALDAPPERLQFDEPIVLAPSSCRIQPIWDIESTNPIPLYFGVVEDGSILSGSTSGGAAAMLDACFYGPGLEPTAEAVAAAVVTLENTPGPLALLDPDLERKLEPFGLTYEPPSLESGAGGTTVTFFAIDRELDIVFSVTANRSESGTLEVEYSELS
jgi:hypothetical protein